MGSKKEVVEAKSGESVFQITYEDDLQQGRHRYQAKDAKEAEVVFFVRRANELCKEFKVPDWFAVRTVLRGSWDIKELSPEERRKLEVEYETKEKAGSLIANLGKFVDTLEHVGKLDPDLK